MWTDPLPILELLTLELSKAAAAHPFEALFGLTLMLATTVRLWAMTSEGSQNARVRLPRASQRR